MTETCDLLIVGSGLMGAAVAELIHRDRPGARIVMVDGGRLIGSRPGQHLHDTTEPDVRAQYLNRVRPGIQSLYTGVGPTPPIRDASRALPGMYSLSSFGSDSTAMPAASLAWNAGGMGVHWTAATPWPWGEEVFDFEGPDAWDHDLDIAQRLLHVHPDPFPHTRMGTRVREELAGLFDGVSAPGRGPQAMPMAISPHEGPPYPRTGPARIYRRMSAPSGDDFSLHHATLATRLVVEHGDVRGAIVRDMTTGATRTIRAGHTVVAADTFRTPQLLFASGIRPRALGRYLNEHTFVTGQVLVDQQRIGVALEDVALPAAGEWMLASHWLPQSGPAQPFHGQIIDRLYLGEDGSRLAYSVGVSIYAPTDIRPENRIAFSESSSDATGMPRMRIDYALSAADRRRVEEARLTQRRIAEALGDFDATRDSAVLAPGSSLHFTGSARAGEVDDGTSVCSPDGQVWGFPSLYLAGGAVVPTAVVGNSTLTAMVTAVRAGRAIGARMASAAARGG
jgi:choline dehydrogenase-like flavoprotein